ncbi:hypothetical protein NN561_009777 [Cricetulus griseus]
MGLGWGNYLISVRRRRTRLQPLSLESNCGTKRAGKRCDLEGQPASEGGAGTGTDTRATVGGDPLTLRRRRPTVAKPRQATFEAGVRGSSAAWTRWLIGVPHGGRECA